MKVFFIFIITAAMIIFSCTVTEIPDVRHIVMIAPDTLQRAPVEYMFEICDSGTIEYSVITFEKSALDIFWTDTLDIDATLDTVDVSFLNNDYIGGKLTIKINSENPNVRTIETFYFYDTIYPLIKQLKPVDYVYFPPCTFQFELRDNISLYNASYYNMATSLYEHLEYEDVYIDTITMIYDSLTDFKSYSIYTQDIGSNQSFIQYQMGPKLIDQFNTHSCTEGNFIVKDGYYIAAEGDFGVSIYDIALQSPVAGINYDNIYAYYIVNSGNFLAVADTLFDVLIYDISNIEEPQYLFSLDFQFERVADILFKDNYLLIALSSGRIVIYDISNPPEVIEVNSFCPNFFPSISILNIKDDFLYIVQGTELYIYDTSSLPGVPDLLNSIHLQEQIRDLIVNNNDLILIGTNYFYYYFLVNNSNPELRKTFDIYYHYLPDQFRSRCITGRDSYYIFNNYNKHLLIKTKNGQVDQSYFVSVSDTRGVSVAIFGDTLFYKYKDEMVYYEFK